MVVDCLVDVAFVIDESGSIRDSNVDGQPDNWGLVMDFIKNAIQLLNIGPTSTNVAAVNFGKSSMNPFPLLIDRSRRLMVD